MGPHDGEGDVPVSRWQFQTSYPTFGFDPGAKAGSTAVEAPP